LRAARGLGALAAAPAMAGDLYCSIGVHRPGVSTTISNARPAVVYPAPAVVCPGHSKKWHKRDGWRGDHHHGWRS